MNGFNLSFNKNFWDLLGDDIFHAAPSWFDQGIFPPMLNPTGIVLIPNKDLRPVSLCNILYKIISKVLSNSLKPLLQKCISQEQSTFVEGGSILDNVPVAIEIIFHHMKCKSHGKHGELVFKIDI